MTEPASNPLEKPGTRQAPSEPLPAAAGARADGEAAVRASDADRDRVADILREALAEGRLNAEEHAERLDAVYAAKTTGELEPLLRDLPAGRRGSGERFGDSGALAREPGRAAAPWPPTGGSQQENVVGIFSGATREGRWRVPGKIEATAIFGGVDIDLTEAIFEQQHVVINATAIFGGVQLKVPENVTLQQKGTGIFGGFDVKATESSDPGAPVVLVKGAAIFGGVEAKVKKGKRLRDLRARLRGEDPERGQP